MQKFYTVQPNNGLKQMLQSYTFGLKLWLNLLLAFEGKIVVEETGKKCEALQKWTYIKQSLHWINLDIINTD